MKSLIITGGGFAGAYIAKELEKEFAVMLIDTKDYFEFTPSVLRVLVEPNCLKKIEAPHTAYLKKAVIVRSKVTAVSTSEVFTGGKLSERKRYPFDYLVIASGSRYNAPIKSSQDIAIAARGEELKDYAQRLEKAQSVLIIGGGVVGTELAAEIAEKFPDKKITIVHAQAELLERNPSKARKYAEKFLRQRGVEIIFKERVLGVKESGIKRNGQEKKEKRGKVEPEVFVTDKKRKISAEIAFFCTGIMPNSEFMKKREEDGKEDIGKKTVDEKGFIQVNEFLQVVSTNNTFAVGDVNDIKEEKTAQSAEKQAEIVVQNLRAMVSGKEPATLKKYVVKPRPMVISLGKWKGIFVHKNVVWAGILPAVMKKIIEFRTMRKYGSKEGLKQGFSYSQQ